MKDEIRKEIMKVYDQEASVDEVVDKLLVIFSIMQVPQFEQLLSARLEELPYTKHLDDGQYNDGQAYGFECGARWAYETLSRGTAVGKAGEDASVSDGK